jgi:hypothetical protein
MADPASDKTYTADELAGAEAPAGEGPSAAAHDRPVVVATRR